MYCCYLYIYVHINPEESTDESLLSHMEIEKYPEIFIMNKEKSAEMMCIRFFVRILKNEMNLP